MLNSLIKQKWMYRWLVPLSVSNDCPTSSALLRANHYSPRSHQQFFNCFLPPMSPFLITFFLTVFCPHWLSKTSCLDTFFFLVSLLISKGNTFSYFFLIIIYLYWLPNTLLSLLFSAACLFHANTTHKTSCWVWYIKEVNGKYIIKKYWMDNADGTYLQGMA